MMPKVARAMLLAALPAELVLAVLLVSGVRLPRPVFVAAECVVLCVILLEAVTAYGLFRAEVRGGADRRTALRGTVDRLVPVQVRRVLAFELKGLAGLALWAARRRHGVPPGAAALSYVREQSSTLGALLFVMCVETAGTEVLLRELGAPTGLRVLFLVVDVYSVVALLAIWAARATRPHVVSPDELRVRSGVFLDVRIPRRLIASVALSRNHNERGTAVDKEGALAVPVAAQTNVVVELTEPVMFVRPLGSPARATTVRFFADAPGAVRDALRYGGDEEGPKYAGRPGSRPVRAVDSRQIPGT